MTQRETMFGAIRWRDCWTRIAASLEPGRTQRRQERIERRAVRANRRVGRLMAAAPLILG